MASEGALPAEPTSGAQSQTPSLCPHPIYNRKPRNQVSELKGH